jgi:hypothetical protein
MEIRNKSGIVLLSKPELADLRGADLFVANLFGANLRRADLCEANLRGANLFGANLCGAKGLLRITGLRDDIVAIAGRREVTIGCQCLDIDEWLDRYKSIGKQHGYSDPEIAEYGRRLLFVAEAVKAELKRRSS